MMRKPLLSRGAMVFVAACLACLFAFPLSAQQNSSGGRAPLVQDWSSRHIFFSKPANNWQAILNLSDPRFMQQYYRRNQGKLASRNSQLGIFGRLFQQHQGTRKDWAVSLGAGGVAQGMYPAKFSFDTNAAPSCANDFAVFPINTVTGNTRATFGSTFTAATTGSTTLTIQPTGGGAVSTTFTAGATNTGTTFIGSVSAASAAANLAAAINRNLYNPLTLGTNPLDQYVAVATGATVNVYTLTPGTGVSLAHGTTTLTNFSGGWTPAGPVTGTNGAQANIIAFNQLYSGTAGTCGPTGNFTFPKFIFSYASGVGPVATSPTLSLDGTKVAYVENDPNIGAILHVLTIASGATEYGACTNTGTAAPTCATAPVIPGSTTGSTATDFMLPLGLLAANAATGAPGALDSFSSPFMHYGFDTLYVGDNNGYLYSILPTFTGTPAFSGGNFPLQLNTTTSVVPTGVTVTGNVVTVTLAGGNAITALQSVTIAGVAANGANCTAADVAAINGGHIAVTANATTITFDATAPNTTASCTITNATVSPGTNILSAPSEDTGGTGNIFVGDSSGNLYMVTPAGVKVGTTAVVGENVNGGVRAGPMIDSGNAVGYVVTACDNSGTLTGNEALTTNSALWQFKFTSNTLTKVAGAELDSGANQGCSAPGFQIYDPTPDERYYALGIGTNNAANNGEIITASSGTGGQQLKAFQFVNSALQTIPEGPAPPAGPDKPQITNGASVMAPLTEFFNSQAFAVASVTAVAGGAGTGVVTVTTTTNNAFAVNDTVLMSGVVSNVHCTAADAAAINGALYTVASVPTAAQFTFDATIPNTTNGTGCTVTTAFAGADYMFMGVEVTPALYTIALPGGVLIPGAASTNPPILAATNTTSVAGGTSGIVIDNDSTSGQASSIYYGTLATSTTICGATAAYCAVKLTQGLLQ
jgi:hypothetical protein